MGSDKRVLVTGASGYVGARLIPGLLEEGYQVRAGFTDPAKAERFWWHDQVEVVALDVLDPGTVDAAMQGVDALLYLVHSMASDDFAEKDRKAARIVADAALAAGVSRIVYLSGIVPDGELSEHLKSRLEVEEILTVSGISTITLRAAVVVGAGSTSFEIIRQISERMPVHTIPSWMNSTVQPIAVVDVIEAIIGAIEVDGPSRHFDVAGPDRLPYADLLDRYSDIAGLTRPQVGLPGIGSDTVGVLAGLITDVPSATVEALIESLHHDMVAAEDDFVADLMPADHRLVGVDEGFRRSLADRPANVDPRSLDPMAAMPFDPDWSGGEGGGLGSAVAGVASVLRSIAVRFNRDS